MDPRPLCSVLMPVGVKADSSGRAINFDRVYRDLVAPALESARMEVSRIHEEMISGLLDLALERLALCALAVVDVTASSPGVLVGLGARLALRPGANLIIAADGQRMPFDVRGLPVALYQVSPSGEFLKISQFRRTMVEELDRLREALQFDSGSVTAPKVLSPPSSDASRQESIRSQKVARRREQLESAQREGVEGLVALEEEILKAGDTPELFRELFLAYWSMGAWDRMVELVTKMPRSLAETQTIQEQLALALNRLGRPGDAENVLLKLLERHGPSSETYGILGRVYKDRWEKSSIQGNQLEAQLLLDKAIDAYRRGLEVDWRDAYLGINAVTLMELKDPPDPHRERLFPVVTYAAERKASTGKPDYWDHAMVLELAVLARDEQRARAAFKAILPLTPAPWELETTARNLRSIREARARRGEHLPWADEIEAACDQMAAEGKKPDGALVIKWAREHKAQNAWDMGTKNWERCLYDLGYPEGKLHRLEFNNDGTLKYQ